MVFKKGDKVRLGIAHTFDTRTKISLSNKGQVPWNKGNHWSKKHKEKFSEIRKRLWQTSGYRNKEILSHKGKKMPEETKEKISKRLTNRQKSEEAKRNMSLATKGKPLSLNHRLNLIKTFESSEYKEKMRQISTELWKNEKYREKTTRAILKGLFKRPTSFESQIIQLINKHQLPFKYVGDGQILICYRNPDFIESNGKKLLIEVYFSLWHPKNYEEQRNKIFSKHGYKTLFLDENDLLNENWEEVCLTKINNFLNTAMQQGVR